MKNYKILDISRDFCSKMVVWPSSKPFQITHLRNYPNDKCKVSEILMNLHTGTHIDAESHFIDGAPDVNDIKLEKVIGPCIVLNFSGVKSVSATHLSQAKALDGVKKIILKTDSSNSSQKEQAFNENYTAIDNSAVEWLIQNKIELVGIDSPSIEAYQGRDYSVHGELFRHNILALEGLDLHLASQGKYFLLAAPLKILKAEASPVRAFLLKFEGE